MSAVADRPRLNYRRLFRDALIAAVLAAGLNALIYFGAAALGAFPQSVIVPRANAPFSVLPVLLLSVAAVFGAALMFLLVARATPRPKRVFWTVAGLVFVVLFFTPFSIPGAPLGMVVALEIMHVTAAAAALWPVARVRWSVRDRG